MTIYIDIVLIENLCMNYIILFGTAYIIKLKIRHFRIIFSSLIGAVYAVLAYTNIFPMYTNIVVKIILSISMIYIAYNPKNIKGMIKELVVFYLVSFALGGCAFALLYIIKPQNIFIKNGVFVGTYPIKIALLGGIVGFTVTYIAFKIVKTKINKKEIIYNVKVKIEDKQMFTKVLLDTGNMLKDPISNEPVMLIEKEKLCDILPSSLLENIENVLGGDFREEIDNMKYRTRLRIVPFTSVGKQNGMMLGIKTDSIKIMTDIDEIIKENVIVCAYEKKFSKTGKYYGLIGLDMFEKRSEKNEFFANAKK